MKDQLVVFMADEADAHNGLWDISRLGGFRRDGWDLGRGDETAFDPRDVDWSDLPAQAEAWRVEKRRRNGASQASVQRCYADPAKLCFYFQ